jgi:hypothetical protein
MASGGERGRVPGHWLHLPFEPPRENLQNAVLSQAERDAWGKPGDPVWLRVRDLIPIRAVLQADRSKAGVLRRAFDHGQITMDQQHAVLHLVITEHLVELSAADQGGVLLSMENHLGMLDTAAASSDPPDLFTAATNLVGEANGGWLPSVGSKALWVGVYAVMYRIEWCLRGLFAAQMVVFASSYDELMARYAPQRRSCRHMSGWFAHSRAWRIMVLCSLVQLAGPPTSGSGAQSTGPPQGLPLTSTFPANALGTGAGAASIQRPTFVGSALPQTPQSTVTRQQHLAQRDAFLGTLASPPSGLDAGKHGSHVACCLAICPALAVHGSLSSPHAHAILCGLDACVLTGGWLAGSTMASGVGSPASGGAAGAGMLLHDSEMYVPPPSEGAKGVIDHLAEFLLEGVRVAGQSIIVNRRVSSAEDAQSHPAQCFPADVSSLEGLVRVTTTYIGTAGGAVPGQAEAAASMLCWVSEELAAHDVVPQYGRPPRAERWNAVLQYLTLAAVQHQGSPAQLGRWAQPDAKLWSTALSKARLAEWCAECAQSGHWTHTFRCPRRPGARSGGDRQGNTKRKSPGGGSGAGAGGSGKPRVRPHKKERHGARATAASEQPTDG